MHRLSIALVLLLLSCNRKPEPQLVVSDRVVSSPGGRDVGAARESSARKALLVLLRGRQEGSTDQFDGVIRELARQVCGDRYDVSDIDKVFPPEYIPHAVLASCGGFLLDDAGVVEREPPRISDAGVQPQ